MIIAQVNNSSKALINHPQQKRQKQTKYSKKGYFKPYRFSLENKRINLALT